MKILILSLVVSIMSFNTICASQKTEDCIGDYYYQQDFDPNKHSYKYIRINLELRKDSSFIYRIWYYMNNDTWECRFSAGDWRDIDNYLLLSCKFDSTEYKKKMLIQELTGFKRLERMSIYLTKKGKNKLKLNEKVLKRAKKR